MLLKRRNTIRCAVWPPCSTIINVIDGFFRNSRTHYHQKRNRKRVLNPRKIFENYFQSRETASSAFDYQKSTVRDCASRDYQKNRFRHFNGGSRWYIEFERVRRRVTGHFFLEKERVSERER